LYPGDACLASFQLLLDSEQLVLILLLITAPVPDLSLEFIGEFFVSCLVSLYPALLDVVLVKVDGTEEPVHPLDKERQIRCLVPVSNL